jgi:thioredoxin-like negative regulator of GroEL
MAASSRKVSKKKSNIDENISKAYKEFIENRDAFKALSLAESILKEECSLQQNLSVKRLLVRCHIRLKHPYEALEHQLFVMEHGNADTDRNSIGYLTLGKLYNRRGNTNVNDIAEAEKIFRKWPLNPSFHVELIYLLISQKRTIEAKKIIESYVNYYKKPSDINVILAHVQFYKKTSNYNKALEVLSAIEPHKRTSQVIRQLIAIYKSMGKVTEAKELANSIIRDNREEKFTEQKRDAAFKVNLNSNSTLTTELDLLFANDEKKADELIAQGDIYSDLFQYEKALVCYNEAWKLSETTYLNSLQLKIAKCLTLLERFSEAEAIYAKPNNENNPLIQAAYAKFLITRGQKTKAISVYNKKPCCDHLDLQIDYAQFRFNEGEIKEAFEILYKSSPRLDNTKVVFLLMLFYNLTQQYDEALAVYQRCSILHSLQLKLTKAKTYSYMGNYRNANEVHQEIISEYGDSLEIRLSIARLFERQNKHDEAQRIYLDKQFSNMPFIRIKYAKFLIRRKNYSGALEELETLDPTAEVVKLKIQCNNKLEKFVNPEKLFNSIGQGKFQPSMEIELEYAEHHLLLDEFDQAEEIYKRLIETKKEVICLEKYGFYLLREKREIAKDIFQRYANGGEAKLIPTARFLLAKYYMKEKKYSEALKTCSKLINDFPYYTKGYELHIKLLIDTEQYKKAINLCKIYIYGHAHALDQKGKRILKDKIYFSNSESLYYSYVHALLMESEYVNANNIYWECVRNFEGNVEFLAELQDLFLSCDEKKPYYSFVDNVIKHAIPEYETITPESIMVLSNNAFYNQINEEKTSLETKEIAPTNLPNMTNAFILANPPRKMPYNNSVMIQKLHQEKLSAIANIPLESFLPPEALIKLRELSKHFCLFIVGGFPRDTLSKGPLKKFDLDIIVFHPKPGEVAEFLQMPINAHNANLIRIKLPTSGNTKEFVIDIFCSPAPTIKANTMRRDAYINTLLVDVHTGNVFDPAGAISDLSNDILTPITPILSEEVETERQIRLLRFISFASRGWILTDPIKSQIKIAIKNLPNSLVLHQPQRVIDFINKIITSGYAVNAFRLLRELGAFDLLFPSEIEDKKENDANFDCVLTKCAEMDRMEETQRHYHKMHMYAALVMSRISRKSPNIEGEIIKRIHQYHGSVIPKSYDIESLLTKVIVIARFFGIKFPHDSLTDIHLETKESDQEKTFDNLIKNWKYIRGDSISFSLLSVLFKDLDTLIGDNTRPNMRKNEILNLIHISINRLRQWSHYSYAPNAQDEASPLNIANIVSSLWKLCEYSKSPIDESIVANLIDKFTSISSRHASQPALLMLKGLINMNYTDVGRLKTIFQSLPFATGKPDPITASIILIFLAYYVFNLNETLSSLNITSERFELFCKLARENRTTDSSESHQEFHDKIGMKLTKLPFEYRFEKEGFFYGYSIDSVLRFYDGKECKLQIAFEFDGPTHFDSEDKLLSTDIRRQRTLENAGFKFIRVNLKKNPGPSVLIMRKMFYEIYNLLAEHKIPELPRGPKTDYFKLEKEKHKAAQAKKALIKNQKREEYKKRMEVTQRTVEDEKHKIELKKKTEEKENTNSMNQYIESTLNEQLKALEVKLADAHNCLTIKINLSERNKKITSYKRDIAELKIFIEALKKDRLELLNARENQRRLTTSSCSCSYFPSTSYTPLLWQPSNVLNETKNNDEVSRIRATPENSLTQFIANYLTTKAKPTEELDILVNDSKLNIHECFNKKTTPLHLFATFCHPNSILMLKHLIEVYKVDINALDEDGLKPIHMVLLSYEYLHTVATETFSNMIRFLLNVYQNKGSFFNTFISLICNKVIPDSTLANGEVTLPLEELKSLLNIIAEENPQAFREREENLDNVLHIIVKAPESKFTHQLVDIILEQNVAAVTQLNRNNHTPRSLARELKRDTLFKKFDEILRNDIMRKIQNGQQSSTTSTPHNTTITNATTTSIQDSKEIKRDNDKGQDKENYPAPYQRRRAWSLNDTALPFQIFKHYHHNMVEQNSKKDVDESEFNNLALNTLQGFIKHRKI